MPDDVRPIRAKFDAPRRYANFGPCLVGMSVHGFRGIDALELDFEFPITVFSGTNGSGKSTLGQLAVCAYKKPAAAQEYKRYYVRDFFPASVADPDPFSATARVVFHYETDVVGTPQELTVSRAMQEWSGYKRQPERHCYYVGFSIYLPKVERRDFSIYRSTVLELRDVREIPEDIRAWVARILNQPYEGVHFQGIGTSKRQGELAMARRLGAMYSENNMGFGEGRVLYMVDLFENAPEKSLFVLEEPETSLHPDAQHRLAKYLLNVVKRRHHQVILSTHSGAILGALPAEARRLIHRDGQGVRAYAGVSTVQMNAVLSGGYQRLDVLVEDVFAKRLLIEILRAEAPDLVGMVRVTAVGSHKSVSEGLRLLNQLGRLGVGFVDGDTGGNLANGVSVLPGDCAPERVVFGATGVQAELEEAYGVDACHLTVGDPEVDHHEYVSRVAQACALPDGALSVHACRAFAEELDQAERQRITNFVRERAADR